MAKFNLLIIDDDSSREQDYKKIFFDADFELNFAFEKNAFFQCNPKRFDCFVIDISLDNWTSEDDVKNMFLRVVEHVGKENPIILLSSKIKEVIHWTNVLLKEHFQPIYTIALEEITIETEGFKKIKSYETSQIICNNIQSLLIQRLKYSTFKKEPDEDIHILHISDIQFGDPGFDDNLCFSFPDSFYRFATENLNFDIDFITITGDIAYDGSPSQFDNAYDWIMKLGARILGKENFKERLLVTPGNHDINLSLSSLNLFKYKYPSKTDTSGKIELVNREPQIDEYTLYALDPFKDFAYRTSNNSQWNTNPSLSYFNNRFSYLGLRFLHLNCMQPFEQLGKNDAIFGISENDIKQLSTENENFEHNIPTIVIAHPSPLCLGYNDDGYSSENWKKLSSLLVNCDAKLFLFGHTHNDLVTVKMPLSEGKSIIRSGTGTLFVDPGKKGGIRGFRILTFERKNNKVINYHEKHFLLMTDSRIIQDTKTFSSNEPW
jgi:DNA repair exonuclease SbcCD nuclease subunit